jgi:hypothetical protein
MTRIAAEMKHEGRVPPRFDAGAPRPQCHRVANARENAQLHRKTVRKAFLAHRKQGKRDGAHVPSRTSSA